MFAECSAESIWMSVVKGLELSDQGAFIAYATDLSYIFIYQIQSSHYGCLLKWRSSARVRQETLKISFGAYRVPAHSDMLTSFLSHIYHDRNLFVMESNSQSWRSHERRYILTSKTFTKSELRQEELPRYISTNERIQPRWSRERLPNEAVRLQYVALSPQSLLPSFSPSRRTVTATFAFKRRAHAVSFSMKLSQNAPSRRLRQGTADCINNTLGSRLKYVLIYVALALDVATDLSSSSTVAQLHYSGWSLARDRSLSGFSYLTSGC